MFARSLFGLEAELAICGSRAGTALSVAQLAAALAARAADTLTHLRGDGSRLYLANGGLLYIDCGAHPEFATPECTTPREAVAHLMAGQRMVAGLAESIKADIGADEVLVLRANVDYKTKATWGAHESYLGRRPVRSYQAWLVPHLVSRIIYAGSGGLNPLSPGIRFSLSPRVAHLMHVVSNESTSARGIYHTRDEALCRGFSRIHVLAGDNACSQRANWLKIGTTALLVALADTHRSAHDLIKIVEPVHALQRFAYDPHQRVIVTLASGSMSKLSAFDIQRDLLERVEASIGTRSLPEWAAEICKAWREALDELEVRNPNAPRYDWILKHDLMRREIARAGFTQETISLWSSIVERLLPTTAAACSSPATLDRARIAALQAAGRIAQENVDAAERDLAANGLRWSQLDDFNALRNRLCAIDVRFGELGGGIFETLDRKGAIPQHRVLTETEIGDAADDPPSASRAAVRGRWVRKLATDKDRYKCYWEGICSAELVLDLTDPFEANGSWRARGEQVPQGA